MKYSFFIITLFFTLLLSFSKGAKFTPSERDMKNYEAATHVKKNITFHGERKLDVYYDKKKINDKKKVVIHIYGGSWVIGDKIGQTKIGQLLEQKGYVSVIPNYILFPEGSIDDMVDDIYQAIQWTYKNISKYGGNPKNISICAHSSGAHLSALTIVKSTLGLKNNGKEMKKLPKLEKVILLNGPYIFNQEFLTYANKNMNSTGNEKSDNGTPSDPEQISILQRLMMTYYGDESISPIALLKTQEKDSVKFNIGKFVFFYTSDDKVVPESSSKNFISEISRTSKTSSKYIYEKGLGHATLTDGVRAGEDKFNDKYMKLIKS